MGEKMSQKAEAVKQAAENRESPIKPTPPKKPFRHAKTEENFTSGQNLKPASQTSKGLESAEAQLNSPPRQGHMVKADTEDTKTFSTAPIKPKPPCGARPKSLQKNSGELTKQSGSEKMTKCDPEAETDKQTAENGDNTVSSSTAPIIPKPPPQKKLHRYVETDTGRLVFRANHVKFVTSTIPPPDYGAILKRKNKSPKQLVSEIHEQMMTSRQNLKLKAKQTREKLDSPEAQLKSTPRQGKMVKTEREDTKTFSTAPIIPKPQPQKKLHRYVETDTGRLVFRANHVEFVTSTKPPPDYGAIVRRKNKSPQQLVREIHEQMMTSRQNLKLKAKQTREKLDSPEAQLNSTPRQGNIDKTYRQDTQALSRTPKSLQKKDIEETKQSKSEKTTKCNQKPDWDNEPLIHRKNTVQWLERERVRPILGGRGEQPNLEYLTPHIHFPLILDRNPITGFDRHVTQSFSRISFKLLLPIGARPNSFQNNDRVGTEQFKSENRRKCNIHLPPIMN
ncbi:hypothetical protein ATANTOWER_000330 [Ataeniobius toweri]|uniref:Uncharacterized protein n=1 Tax=Ataeniobius toweri TaxID=208326 RepID=A0ABU7BWU4_9TELE|nr:hypothetical protein [Ataeniobius toweri]